ncbi:MAG: disulfide bond formation protein B [Bauldia sp.]
MQAVKGAWLYGAWLVALLSSLAALFIGEVLGQEPCTLCWFQRVCMFPLAIVLGIGAFRSDVGVWRYALPLAVIGLGIALFHSLLFAGVISEALQPCAASGPSCSGEGMRIFNTIPIPYLAVLGFGLIIIALLGARRSSR